MRIRATRKEPEDLSWEEILIDPIDESGGRFNTLREKIRYKFDVWQYTSIWVNWLYVATDAKGRHLQWATDNYYEAEEEGLDRWLSDIGRVDEEIYKQNWCGKWCWKRRTRFMNMQNWTVQRFDASTPPMPTEEVQYTEVDYPVSMEATPSWLYALRMRGAIFNIEENYYGKNINRDRLIF